MALQPFDCPHCRQERPMESLGVSHGPPNGSYFFFVCPACRLPIVVLAAPKNPSFEYRRDFDVHAADLPFKKCGWSILDSWPKPAYRTTEPPQGVPEEIGTLFAQSQDVALQGANDLAVMGFVRVLKMAQAAYSPASKQKLQPWIVSLIAAGDLTSALRSWVDRVKGLCNGAEGCTTQDVEELGTFVHVILEQLFGIGSKVAAFRRRAAAG